MAALLIAEVGASGSSAGKSVRTGKGASKKQKKKKQNQKAKRGFDDEAAAKRVAAAAAEAETEAEAEAETESTSDDESTVTDGVSPPNDVDQDGGWGGAAEAEEARSRGARAEYVGGASVVGGNVSVVSSTTALASALADGPGSGSGRTVLCQAATKNAHGLCQADETDDLSTTRERDGRLFELPIKPTLTLAEARVMLERELVMAPRDQSGQSGQSGQNSHNGHSKKIIEMHFAGT